MAWKKVVSSLLTSHCDLLRSIRVVVIIIHPSNPEGLRFLLDICSSPRKCLSHNQGCNDIALWRIREGGSALFISNGIRTVPSWRPAPHFLLTPSTHQSCVPTIGQAASRGHCFLTVVTARTDEGLEVSTTKRWCLVLCLSNKQEAFQFSLLNASSPSYTWYCSLG